METASLNSKERLFKKGQLIANRYQVEELLGSGGMGWVLRVKDQLFQNQELALKVLYPHLLLADCEYSRFQNEVSVTRRLSHPAIVQTYGFGTDACGLPYVAMEYVEGQTLKHLINLKNNGLPFQLITKIIIQLVEGLKFAHQSGIIHRDLKPENILIKNHHIIKIADFGLAQVFCQEAHLTQTGKVVGTPHYMSPEQILGKPLSKSTDIYSFGLMLFELAAGFPPFQGKTLLELAEQHCSEPIPELPKRNEAYPEWFKRLIIRSVQKKPEERFESFESISDFLHHEASIDTSRFSSDIAAVPVEPPAPENPWTLYLRRWSPLAIAIFILLCVFGPTLYYSHNNHSVRSRIATEIFHLERHLHTELKLLKWIWGVKGTQGDNPALLPLNMGYMILPLIRSGSDPNQINPKTRNTSLHLLCAQNAITQSQIHRITEIIQNHAANLNARNKDGNTPLHLAVINLSYDTMVVLLENGANPNIINHMKQSPLVLAVRINNLRFASLLLTYKANTNISLFWWGTPLHIAAGHHNPELIRWLLKHQANPNAQDELGQTPLMLAIGKNTELQEHAAVLNLLIKATDLSIADNTGQTPFHYAQKTKDNIALSLISNQEDSDSLHN